MQGWHARAIHPRRSARIADALATLAPSHAARLLDVGAGDGRIAALLAERLAASHVEGVDVHRRRSTAIAVRAYDGRTLPYEDASFDVATLVDVLHHADDPARLLRETLRVVRTDGVVLVKDHFARGPLSRLVLLAMDVAGNAAHGVIVTGRYFDRAAWRALVAAAGAREAALVSPLVVHDAPWRWVARSEYQFVARLERRR